MHYCEVPQVTRTVHTEGANMDPMTLEPGEEVQYRHKMNPRQRWKDSFRAIIKQTGNSAYKPEKDLNAARPRFKLCRIVDLAKDSWRVENDELKELRMSHPDLGVVLYNFYVCGELLRQVREPKAFGEIDNFLEQLIGRPLEYFTESEQRKLMGCYLTNLKLPHYMVGYYTYLLGSIGARSCHDTTFNNMEAEGTIPLIFTVRSLLWTCADMSEEFATALAKTDYIGYLATELQELAPRIQLIKENNFTLVSNLVTLCICAMLPENRRYFREQNVTSCLIPYLQSPATVIKILALLTLSYIIDDSENHLLLADDSSFDFIMGLLTQALGKQGEITQGFTVSEILNGLLGLSRSDENKALMAKKGVIQLLMSIIESGAVEEQKPALKLIWQLAFLEENKELLKQEMSLMHNLRKIRDNNQNDELRHLATGTLWVMEGRKLKNLDDDMLYWLLRPEGLGPSFIGPLTEDETRKLEEDHAEYLMLSYSWENQRMALEIRDRLKAAGYNVWMDVDDLSGSTLEAMADAVENATLVLVCVSEGYKESLACRTEAEYAYKLGKTIIPLRLQSGYKPDGWLGILAGTKLYFDFTPDNWLDDKMKELIRELGDRGKSKDVDSVDNFDGVDLRDWTRKEIVEWLTVHELFANKALKRLSAEDLNFLWFLYNRCPEYFFKYCRSELGISRLSDMRKLNDAMMSLG